MPPKPQTPNRWIGGRTRRSASTAAACALVLASAGCGSGGSKSADGPAPAATDGVTPGAAASAPESFTFPPGFTTTGLTVNCKWPPCTAISPPLPAYAVTKTVDVKVGKHPFALAVNPKTDKIYTANIHDNTVTVIDGKTNKTTTIKAGNQPAGVAVNTVTNKIYVSNTNLDSKTGNEIGTVTVIDGATNKTTTVPAQGQPANIAVNEKTDKIYVVNNSTNSMTVIDGKTNKVDANIAFRPDGHADLTTGVLSPFEVKVNEATNQVWVTGPQSNTVAVIDGATNKFTVVSTGQTPTGATVNPTTNQIYVTDMTDNAITVIDGATNKTSTIKLEDVQDPLVIAANPNTNKIFVADQTSKAITVIDGATKAVTTFGDLPGKPHDVAINMKTNKVYFPCFVFYRGNGVGDDKAITGVIQELDPATNTITTILAGVTPFAIAVNSNTNKVYAINQDSDTVTVLSE